MSCLFCNIVNRAIPAEIVFEDDATLAFRDIRPVAPTHVLVIPKQHVSAVHELGESDAALAGRLFVAARIVAEREGLTTAGFRLVVNDGEDAGQSVHHLHVHVLGGRTLAWPPG